MQSDGLGDLVDDYYGSNDLKTGWVGFNLSKIVLTFEFTKKQSFSSLVFRLRALARTEKLLERIEISSSNDGQSFTLVRTMSHVMKQSNGDKLTIPIHVNSAKFIRCILTTNKEKDYLLISEVSFEKGM